MFRFIHSADWQLGARFCQFGPQADALRQARLQTLATALQAARQRSVDAFLVAGDLFEDNQVDENLTGQVLRLFGDFQSVRIFILPGNHDPLSGPEAVWNRRPFTAPPANVTVLREAGALAVGAAWLLCAPLQQKVSTLDPSSKLVALAQALPPESIKIGITHGALAIPGMFKPNDFPIALDAASRAGLTYLAVGHWHGWQADLDGGRLVMPGTPEPDSFEQTRSGFVALVEIEGPGATPKVEPLRVSTLHWQSLEYDLLSSEAARSSLGQELSRLAERGQTCVVRVRLRGAGPPALLTETRSWLATALAPFLVGQVVDESTVALSEAEIRAVQTEHPILAQVLADLSRLETFATGQALPPGADAAEPLSPNAVQNGPYVVRLGPEADAAEPLSLAEAQRLLAQGRLELSSLTSQRLSLARQLLWQTAKEAGL